jgi:hypothetical protein
MGKKDICANSRNLWFLIFDTGCIFFAQIAQILADGKEKISVQIREIRGHIFFSLFYFTTDITEFRRWERKNNCEYPRNPWFQFFDTACLFSHGFQGIKEKCPLKSKESESALVFYLLNQTINPNL